MHLDLCLVFYWLVFIVLPTKVMHKFYQGCGFKFELKSKIDKIEKNFGFKFELESELIFFKNFK